MSNSKLLSLTIQRFKSFESPTRLDFAPLTIILGRNNCGKSSLIQSLLLLKQTLNDPRDDVMLRLEGMIDAFHLRELTFGWPAQSHSVLGPTITLEWESEVDMAGQFVAAGRPDRDEVAKNSGIEWIRTFRDNETLRTKMEVSMREMQGIAHIAEIKLWSQRCLEDDSRLSFPPQPTLTFRFLNGEWRCYWHGQSVATKLIVQFEHFIPFLLIDRRNIGPRNRERSWHNAYLMVIEQPLAELTKILSELHFLGSSRFPPPTMFKAATAAPNEVGVSGEFAAQLLHKRQHDLIHFLPPLETIEGEVKISDVVRVRPLVEAVNDVMKALSIDAPLKVEAIQEVGFRVMFGQASLMHVGRGLNSLLPMIELGLFADPIRFVGPVGDMPLSEYNLQCKSFAHIALEEPEAHLHPKVCSRLAHWLVSLAMTNRRLIVETHSDHLVRRLRGLAARAQTGSELETWLLKNVAIVEVDQIDGRSVIKMNHLTSEGGVAETWPADFMDEATDEESAIYYAKIEKNDTQNTNGDAIHFEDGSEPEFDEAP